MKEKLFAFVVSGSFAVAVGYGIATSGDDEKVFCHLAAIIPGEPVEHNGMWLFPNQFGGPDLWVEPTPCGDLWGFLPQDLDRVDGVMFQNCVIVWKDGGRTTAERESIPCTPS